MRLFHACAAKVDVGNIWETEGLVNDNADTGFRAVLRTLSTKTIPPSSKMSRILNTIL